MEDDMSMLDMDLWSDMVKVITSSSTGSNSVICSDNYCEDLVEYTVPPHTHPSNVPELVKELLTQSSENEELQESLEIVLVYLRSRLTKIMDSPELLLEIDRLGKRVTELEEKLAEWEKKK